MVKMRPVLLKLVKGEIIVYDQENDKRRTDTNSKPEHVYERKYFIPEEVPVSDGEIGFQHLFLVDG
jgi:hypothetical protein